MPPLRPFTSTVSLCRYQMPTLAHSIKDLGLEDGVKKSGQSAFSSSEASGYRSGANGYRLN
jgi:hypothetical protein